MMDRSQCSSIHPHQHLSECLGSQPLPFFFLMMNSLGSQLTQTNLFFLRLKIRFPAVDPCLLIEIID